MSETNGEKYSFFVPEEGEDQVDPNLPLKDRVLVISRTQDYKLSFQDMHDMRAMYLKDGVNAEKAVAREKQKVEDCAASVKKWDEAIAQAEIDLPELEGVSGIVSPIQEEDLEGGDEEVGAGA